MLRYHSLRKPQTRLERDGLFVIFDIMEAINTCGYRTGIHCVLETFWPYTTSGRHLLAGVLLALLSGRPI